MAFDKKNNEGVVGTMSGSIRYLNWTEGTNVRIATSYVNGHVNSTSFLYGSEANPLFITGDQNGCLKLWTSKTCDQLLQFSLGHAISAVAAHPT